MTTTLNEIVNDIEFTYRLGLLSASDKISRNQIIKWVFQYRLLILKQTIDKDKEINDLYTQQITGFELQQVGITKAGPYEAKNQVLESVKELPRLMILHEKPSLLLVFDMEGNPIQVGSKTKLYYQKHRRFTGNDYILYIQGQKLRLEGPNLINMVDILVILEDPSEMYECGFEDMPFPMPEDKIPLLKNMIFSQELGLRSGLVTDTTTNARDDAALLHSDINQKQLNQAQQQMQ